MLIVDAQIVDAQVHIWGADAPACPWPAGGLGRAHRPQPFSKDDLLREMDGLVGLFRAEVAGPQASRPEAGGPFEPVEPLSRPAADEAGRPQRHHYLAMLVR